MKTIGVIAGVSWESSIDYYRILNEEVSRRLGGLHSARIAMYSVDFEDVEGPLSAGRRDQAAATIVEAGKSIQSAGADFSSSVPIPWECSLRMLKKPRE